MNSLPLDGLKIIDLSTRLPGPLSTKVLSDLGATVIKIEDTSYGDPFGQAFKSWYEALNSNKKIIKLDFNSINIKEEIFTHVHDCDGIILGINDTLQRKLGVHPRELKTKNICTFLEIKSQVSSDHGMHDLNILAKTHLLNLYLHNKKQDVEAPPFLPLAGINFGQSIASHFLANYLKAQKLSKNIHAVCFLDDSIKKTLSIFFDLKNPEYKSLHSGLYPCYNLYKTKDHNYVALAAIEEKYWNKFLRLFELPSSLDRFDSKEEVFKTLVNLFSNKTLDEINATTLNQDICLSLVKIG